MFCTNNNIDVNNNIEDIELTKQWSLPNPDVMVKLLKRKNLFDHPFGQENYVAKELCF